VSVLGQFGLMVLMLLIDEWDSKKGKRDVEVCGISTIQVTRSAIISYRTWFVLCGVNGVVDSSYRLPFRVKRQCLYPH